MTAPKATRRQQKAEKSAEVKITAAKGRPMLSWVGKRPLTRVTSFPAQHVETFDPSGDAAQRAGPEWDDWPTAYPRGGLLFHGDNKEVLAHLLANGFRGKVDLIYIDPPFDSGADYVRRVSLRGAKGTARLDGEGYTLGEQIQYTDIWANDNYLQFMFERLLLLKELMSEEGFIFLQCDHRKNHHLRSLMDEVLGPDNFRNEIASRRGISSIQAQFESLDSLIPGYYTTLLYSKSRDARLPLLRNSRRVTKPGKWDTLWRGHDRPTMRYELLGVTPQTGQWRWAEPRAKRAEANYRHCLENVKGEIDIDTYYLEHLATTGEALDFVRLSPDETVQAYIPPQADRLANNVWMDLPHMGSVSDYPTEKAEQFLSRIISWASQRQSLVLDCFLGSGTTAAVAQKLGRRWIGCDINTGAIQTTSKRLQEIIEDQVKSASQGTLVEDDSPGPVQLSFTTWRVNDYDLQIQHNEAVNLAVEHIGIQRTRTDRFFDGTLGKSLVKIAPFTHPLSPADLEEIRQELEARPEDDRNVTVVCLGIEIAAQGWLEDWNRHRRGRNAVNRIEVIELRTDERYGAWLAHEPARAKVRIERKKATIHVTIDDFVSPTIVKRLAEQTGVVEPRIDDWRAMVDCVMIDASYDGEVFDISLSDVPERKSDLVSGSYELSTPKGKTTVAVKIVDMLGEEVLVTKQV
jgi:DNA modification methylase